MKSGERLARDVFDVFVTAKICERKPRFVKGNRSLGGKVYKREPKFVKGNKGFGAQVCKGKPKFGSQSL